MAHDLIYQDDALQATFFGNLADVPDPPSRLVNIFVSSSKTDLEHERRQLHEEVIPSLQREWSSLGLDIQLVDVQNGVEGDVLADPHAIAHHLEEIADCYRTSLGCFFLCLIGNKSQPIVPPASIEENDFAHIRTAATEAGLDVIMLDTHYRLDANQTPSRYVLLKHTQNGQNGQEPSDKDDSCEEDEDKLVRIIQYGARTAIREGLIKTDSTTQAYLLSGVHTHLKHAVNLCNNDKSRIVCVVRQFEGVDNNAPQFTDGLSNDDDCTDGLQNLLEDVILCVDKRNVAYFSLPWSKSGLDPSIPEHTAYLKSFSEAVSSRLKGIIDKATQNQSLNWSLFPSAYRKSVQEVYRESQSHLLNSRRYLQELGVSQSLGSNCLPLMQIQKLMQGEDEKLRHAPIIVCGKDGCGKSTLLALGLTYAPEWLGGDVIRIVRHVCQSPCSTYTSELLRNLCEHIALVFDLPLKPHSYELGKLSIWFQDLLKMVESTPTDLVIILDDLHELRFPAGCHSAILGWLPWNLPPNVHVICSISEEADEVLRLLKSRSSCGDNFVFIHPLNPESAFNLLVSKVRDRKRNLSQEQGEAVRKRLEEVDGGSSLYVTLLSKIVEMWHSWMTHVEVPGTLEEVIDRLMSSLKEKWGFRTLRKVSTFLACTTFGLRENELIELLASAVDDKKPAATLREMKSLLKEYYVDRRPYLHWSHGSISKYIMRKFLKTDRDLHACYTELANAFHLGFLMEKEKEENQEKDPAKRKDDWCDILREIDEMWIHLLRSMNRDKLKQEVICNFDFLQCAVSGASVSYVRSVLELVKCHVLCWEVELLLAVTKQAVEVLSQDPSQLATELLNWLKPYAELSDSASVKGLLSSALKFCNRSILPRLVPTNAWLTLSLPLQVMTMTVTYPVTQLVTTPDSQHVLCATNLKEVTMYHLPSKNQVQVFKGHKADVTCLHVTSSGRWLVTGSDDTDVLVWQIESAQIRHRMSNHITGVLCVMTTHSESLVLSGSEMGVVIIANLDNGQVVQKLDRHRGLISCIAVNSGDDIFATGSSDKTVCVWSLEDYSLLNTITLPSGVRRMDVSRDSTFLALACDDNSLHVRSLTTGSEVHRLRDLATNPTALCFAHDNCRCVVGCADGKIYVFDIHSASLINTLAGHTDTICSVQIQANDTFLVSASGNKVVVWNFATPKRELNNHIKPKVKRLDSHREPIVCLAVSKDGTLAVSGSKDNLVKVWNLTTGKVSQSLSGHTASVTCISIAPNSLIAISGSEDTTLLAFGLTSGLVETTFKEHQHKIVSVSIALDSRRILSVDSQGYHRLWTADAGTQLYVSAKPIGLVDLYSSVVFAVSGKNDNVLKFWPLMDAENEKSVSHSDSILCYTATHDCCTIITGSNDMSLKVWEVATGKLTQVLAGHEGAVTCVSVAPLSPSVVASGSADCTIILWDMLTGNDLLTFRGHSDTVQGVNLTPNASALLSASLDNTIQLWNTQTGERISVFDLHAQLVTVNCSFNLSQVIVQLAKSSSVPILRLHNNPAKGITLDMLPGHKEDHWNIGPASVLPKRVLQKGNLKREQSFDSLYWDLKASSPRHEFLPNLDDLKRQPLSSSPVWDGTKALQSKQKVSKHKLLKKQQSMFAFFPDHNQSQQTTGFTRDLESRKADLLAKIQSANKQLLDSPSENPGRESVDDDSQGQGRADVIDSTICAIA